MVPETGFVAGSLGGIRVTFDGLPAPLLYAGPDQINAIAPWAIANRTATQISISRDSNQIAGASIPVANATPEIFTLSASGTGGGAITNQDGTVNTPLNAATAGSVISIYGTGLGPLDPAGVDGAIADIAHAGSAVSVTIGGRTAEVLYAGSAPSQVSGVFQINCRVPGELMAGAAVEVRVTSGEAQSASGITVAIR
jgi:uncharacterized protein (TIGR03437 family)